MLRLVPELVCVIVFGLARVVEDLCNDEFDESNDFLFKNSLVKVIGCLLDESQEVFNLFKFNFEDTYLNLQFGSHDLLLSDEEFRLNGLDVDSICSGLDKIIHEIKLILEIIMTPTLR